MQNVKYRHGNTSLNDITQQCFFFVGLNDHKRTKNPYTVINEQNLGKRAKTLKWCKKLSSTKNGQQFLASFKENFL